jgi:hypothetical protein
MKCMKNKIIAALIAILPIASVVTFAGCVEKEEIKPSTPTALGREPTLSWTKLPDVIYDYSLYQFGTVYWIAQARFINTGSEGRVSFTVTLEKEGKLVGYKQAEQYVDQDVEYILNVRGHINTFPRADPLTIHCPLKISSSSLKEEVEVGIELTTRMDYIYLDSISISPA